jgi:hypothetical protein
VAMKFELGEWAEVHGFFHHRGHRVHREKSFTKKTNKAFTTKKDKGSRLSNDKSRLALHTG